MTLPEGWTDDMSVRMDSDRSVEDLVRFVMASLAADKPFAAILEEVAADFRVHEEDSDLVLDRVQGGIIRALTANPANAPSEDKDPLAWQAFQVVWATFPRAGWFSMRRKAGGPWEEWYEARRHRNSA